MGTQSSKDQITYNTDNCLNQNEADQLRSLVLEELRWTRNIAIGQIIISLGIALLYGIMKTVDKRIRSATKNNQHKCIG